MVNVTLPLLLDEFVGNIEGIVLTIFAGYQGSAEAAVWILMSYVWSFVELIPDCFGEAASTRVVRHLSKARKDVAQQLSLHSAKIGFIISVFCSVILFCWGNFFVWCLSLDDTLEQMLLEILPYIVICQPFASVGSLFWELNDALYIYKEATFACTVISIVFTIPYAAIMTYVCHYNIEGLASAMCISYTASGVVALYIFVGADWDRAVRKANIH